MNKAKRRNAVLLLGQRRRRWANIRPALVSQSILNLFSYSTCYIEHLVNRGISVTRFFHTVVILAQSRLFYAIKFILLRVGLRGNNLRLRLMLINEKKVY